MTRVRSLVLLLLLLSLQFCAALPGAEFSQRRSQQQQQQQQKQQRYRRHHRKAKAHSSSLSRDTIKRDNSGWFAESDTIPSDEAIRYSATATNQRARLAHAALASVTRDPGRDAIASVHAPTGDPASTRVQISESPQEAAKGEISNAAEEESDAEASLAAQDAGKLGRMLRYWGGRMMVEPDVLNVYLVWYGDWSHEQMNIVRNFMASLEAHDGGGAVSRDSSSSGIDRSNRSDSGNDKRSGDNGSNSKSNSTNGDDSQDPISGTSTEAMYAAAGSRISGDNRGTSNTSSSGNSKVNGSRNGGYSSGSNSNIGSGGGSGGVKGTENSEELPAPNGNVEPATVAGWWDITTQYYADFAGRRAAARVRLAGEITDSYSLSPLGSVMSPLSHDDVRQILRQAMDEGRSEHLPQDPSAAYVILTSGDVHLTEFCRGFCAYHTSATIVDGGPKLAYAFVGDSTKQCPQNCTYRYFDEGYTGSNRDLAADSVVDKLAHELTELVTNPFQGEDERAGWVVGGEGTDETSLQQIENADLCEWRYSGVNRDGNGRHWNLQGLNGTRYLIQDNFNVELRRCVQQGEHS